MTKQFESPGDGANQQNLPFGTHDSNPAPAPGSGSGSESGSASAPAPEESEAGDTEAGLLEDLESIKDLLQESDDPLTPISEKPASEEPASEDPATKDPATERVPLLDETVGQDIFERSTIGLTDATLQTLLDDTWSDALGDLLGQTRERIADNGNTWLPEATDDLDDALRTRIDASVQSWLVNLVNENLHSLKAQIVDDLSIEIRQLLDEKLTRPGGPT